MFAFLILYHELQKCTTVFVIITPAFLGQFQTFCTSGNRNECSTDIFFSLFYAKSKTMNTVLLLLLLLLFVVLNHVSCYACYTGESAFNAKTEADRINDEHPHDDKPRPYVCTVCEKRFTQKGHLKQHRKRHTGGKFYSCTHCEKRFITQNYLTKHMNVHSSKYKCSECGKCCQNNRALTVHRRIHSGEKPFECNDCKKTIHNDWKSCYSQQNSQWRETVQLSRV